MSRIRWCLWQFKHGNALGILTYKLREKRIDDIREEDLNGGDPSEQSSLIHFWVTLRDQLSKLWRMIVIGHCRRVWVGCYYRGIINQEQMLKYLEDCESL